MSLAPRSLVVVALVALALAGCAPPWRVVRSSGNPALHGVRDVAVFFDYSQMSVDGMPLNDYLAKRNAEDKTYQTTFDDLMHKYEEAVLSGMRAGYPSAHRVDQGQGQVVVRFQPHSFEMGKFIPFVLPPTRMATTLFYEAGGQVLDELGIQTVISVSVVNPSVFQHVGPLGMNQGALAARYLESR